jgi:hypothetical protein
MESAIPTVAGLPRKPLASACVVIPTESFLASVTTLLWSADNIDSAVITRFSAANAFHMSLAKLDSQQRPYAMCHEKRGLAKMHQYGQAWQVTVDVVAPGDTNLLELP